MRLPLTINGVPDEDAYVRGDDVSAVYRERDAYNVEVTIVELRNGARLETEAGKDEVLRRMGVERSTPGLLRACIASIKNSMDALGKQAPSADLLRTIENLSIVVKTIYGLVESPETDV
jgi:hypothetical protein